MTMPSEACTLADIPHVRRKGTEQPVGRVVPLSRLISETEDTTLVCWGVQDKKTYEERVPVQELEDVPYKIFSPEEVQIRQAEESGLLFKIEGDTND